MAEVRGPSSCDYKSRGRIRALLTAALITLLHIAASSAQRPTYTVPFFFNNSKQVCLYDTDCGFNRFCDRPALGPSKGVCSQCWRCCLFPDLFTDCPQSCNCLEGSQCSHPADCGQGLFCSIADPMQVPKCKKCTSCMNDTESIFGTCASSCPSGALGSTVQGSNLREFMYFSFSASEISLQAVNGLLGLADVNRWVQRQGFNGSQVTSVVKTFDSSGQDPMPVSTFVGSLLSKAPISIICPTLPPRSSRVKPATTVFPGCPCNATANAATFMCPAGHRCSPDAYHGLSTDAIIQQTATQLQALCVPCSPGLYCPSGSFALNESDLTAFNCPEGSYCPNPDEALPCPAGSYCLDGFVEPITCDIELLLNTTPYLELPLQPETVVHRVRRDGDPMRGNICPAGATKPNAICPAGFYCPNVSTQIVCPKGHFCMGQNLAPVKCAPLTSCDPGTGDPDFSGLAFLIAGLIALSLPAIWLLLRYADPATHVPKIENVPMAGRQLHRNTAFAVTKNLMHGFKTDVDLESLQNPVVTKFSGFGCIRTRVQLEFECLGMRMKSHNKTILHGVTGIFPSGKLNAVIGPSGSGKTTFLNVLAGKVGGNALVTGRVHVNGSYMPLEKLKAITGFVPQDDIVHEDLSVRENLYYAADLKLPRSSVNKARRAAIVNDVLEMMQLRHIQHFKVGSVEKRGISGGQRKRVSIGLELVSQPSVLFLDEPTSGLDSTASSDILKSLSDMATLGMTVVSVIHQPRFSSYMLFDQVLLLGHGGETVFMGHPGVAVLYFDRGLNFRMPRRENPADVLMDVIGGKVLRTKSDGKVDHDFKPPDLAKWWKVNGVVWMEEVERLNPLLRQPDLAMNDDTIELINAEFLRCSCADTGMRYSISSSGKRVNSNQLVEIFTALDLPMPHDDVILLMRWVHDGNRQRHSREEVSDANGATTPDADLTISREELIDALQNTLLKHAEDAKIDPLDRFASVEARYVFPNIDITSATAAQRVQSVAMMTRLPSKDMDRFGGSMDADSADGEDGGMAYPVGEGTEVLIIPPGLFAESEELMKALEGQHVPMPALPRMVQQSSNKHRPVGSTSINKRGNAADGSGPQPPDTPLQSTGGAAATQIVYNEIAKHLDTVKAASSTLQSSTPKLSALQRLRCSARKSLEMVGWYNFQRSPNLAGTPTGAQSSQAEHSGFSPTAFNRTMMMSHAMPRSQAEICASPTSTPTGFNPFSLILRNQVYKNSTAESRRDSRRVDSVGSRGFGTPSHTRGAPRVSAFNRTTLMSRAMSRSQAQLGDVIPAGAPTAFNCAFILSRNQDELHAPSILRAPYIARAMPQQEDDWMSGMGNNSRLCLNARPLAEAQETSDDESIANVTPRARYNRTSGSSKQRSSVVAVGTAAAVATHEDGTATHVVIDTASSYAPLNVGETDLSLAQALAERPSCISHPSGSSSSAREAEMVLLQPLAEHPSRTSANKAREGGATLVQARAETEIQGQGGPKQKPVPSVRKLAKIDSIQDRADSSGTEPESAASGDFLKHLTARERRTRRGSTRMDRSTPHDEKGASTGGAPPCDNMLVESLLGSVIQKSVNLTRGSMTAQSRHGSMSGTRGAPQRTLTGQSQRAITMRRMSMNGGNKNNESGQQSLEADIIKWKFPGFVIQLLVLLQRSAVKYMRSFWPLRVIDTLLLLCAALIIGFIHGTGWSIDNVPSNVAMAMTALGVLCMVTHLRTFTTNRVLFLREANSGVSLPSYFLSQNVIDLGWVFLSPALFLAPYYFLTLPRIAFSTYYVAALEVCWWCSGMAYMVSTALPPQTVLMTGVFIALILGAFFQGLTPSIADARGTYLEYFLGISYNRWVIELVTVNEGLHYVDNMRNMIIVMFSRLGMCGMDMVLVSDGAEDGVLTPREAISFLQVQRTFTFDHCDKFNAQAHVAMIFLGLGFRVVAFIFLFFSRKTQY